MLQPKPKPVLIEVVKGKKKVFVVPKVEVDTTPVEVVQFEMSIHPRVGGCNEKVGVAVSLRMTFLEGYSAKPLFSIVSSKGLDDDQIDSMKREIDDIFG